MRFRRGRGRGTGRWMVDNIVRPHDLDSTLGRKCCEPSFLALATCGLIIASRSP